MLSLLPTAAPNDGDGDDSDKLIVAGRSKGEVVEDASLCIRLYASTFGS